MPTALYGYIAYGLTIDSEIAMPELVEIQPSLHGDSLSAPLERQVSIRLGRVDRTGVEKPVGGPVLWADRQDVCLYYEEVGAYRILRGREIMVDLVPDANERTVRLYLLGPALAILLHQRSLLVVHASAVSVDGRVAVFAGEKGEGKSTLAAAMHSRGHPLVTDDLLPVDLSNPDRLLVQPGFPQLKLMPEAAAQLTANPEALPRLHPSFEKRATAAAENFPRDPLPLARIFILETADQDEIGLIPPQQRFIELVRHSYLAILLGATGESRDHFRQVVTLAQRVPVLRLRRRRSLGALAEHAKLIEAELGKSTPPL
jgi:hypothetical protein